MRRLARDLLFAALGAACALAATAPAAASDAVPQDRLVAALVAYDWRPEAARAIVADAPAVAVAELYPSGGRFVPAAYGGPRVELGTAWPLALTVEHEYRHAWEFVRVGYSDARMTAAFDRLAARGDDAGRLARWIAATKPNDIWHWNHWLIGPEGLRWDYAAVPDEHRAEWFGYGRIRRITLLPDVRR